MPKGRRVAPAEQQLDPVKLLDCPEYDATEAGQRRFLEQAAELYRMDFEHRGSEEGVEIQSRPTKHAGTPLIHVRIQTSASASQAWAILCTASGSEETGGSPHERWDPTDLGFRLVEEAPEVSTFNARRSRMGEARPSRSRLGLQQNRFFKAGSVREALVHEVTDDAMRLLVACSVSHKFHPRTPGHVRYPQRMWAIRVRPAEGGCVLDVLLQVEHRGCCCIARTLTRATLDPGMGRMAAGLRRVVENPANRPADDDDDESAEPPTPTPGGLFAVGDDEEDEEDAD